MTVLASDFVFLMSMRMCRSIMFSSVQTQTGPSLDGLQHCTKCTPQAFVCLTDCNLRTCAALSVCLRHKENTSHKRMHDVKMNHFDIAKFLDEPTPNMLARKSNTLLLKA